MLNKLEAWLVGLACGLIVVGVVGVGYFLRYYQDKFYPGIYIDGVNVGGLTLDQASQRLPAESNQPQKTVRLQVENIEIASSSADLGLQRSYQTALKSGLSYGKQGSVFQQLLSAVDLTFKPVKFASTISYDPEKISQLVALLAQEVDSTPIRPKATLRYSQTPSSVTINPGKTGRRVEQNTTAALIQSQAVLTKSTIQAPVASVGAELNTDEIAAARQRATNLVGKRIFLHSGDSSIQLTDQEIISLLTFPSGISETDLNSVLAEWKTTIERQPQDAKFDYDPQTLKVTLFQPSRDGLTLHQEETFQTISNLISQAEAEQTSDVLEAELALTRTPPQISLAQTNTLGINELIGLGESEYDHSIPSRIHNVTLTTSRITNYIIKPGEEFSFNQALGEVSALTGFQPAYIIQNGQTVLGDGGGVCQVSTTLFRAVLDAGLKVTRRLPHSYRVSYYELNSKPGVDATVYSGNTDLRFINDTDHYILIHGVTDNKNLSMKIELYGTSDGRTTTITNHKTWDYRPAPPAVYIPDPALAPGEIKQIDWAASGIRASFTNVIKDKNGDLIREDTYTSNYIPWSAKYLQGV